MATEVTGEELMVEQLRVGIKKNKKFFFSSSSSFFFSVREIERGRGRCSRLHREVSVWEKSPSKVECPV